MTIAAVDDSLVSFALVETGNAGTGDAVVVISSTSFVH
jgi:hypothetical protein